MAEGFSCQKFFSLSFLILVFTDIRTVIVEK